MTLRPEKRRSPPNRPNTKVRRALRFAKCDGLFRFVAKAKRFAKPPRKFCEKYRRRSNVLQTTQPWEEQNGFGCAERLFSRRSLFDDRFDDAFESGDVDKKRYPVPVENAVWQKESSTGRTLRAEHEFGWREKPSICLARVLETVVYITF